MILFNSRRVFGVGLLLMASALSGFPRPFYMFFEPLIYGREAVLILGLCSLVGPLAWRFLRLRAGGAQFEREMFAYLGQGAPRRRQHAALAVAWSLLLCGLSLGLRATIRMEPSPANLSLHKWLTQESGPWESLGAFSLVAGGVILICTGAACRRGSKRRSGVSVPLVIGVFLCIAAGEEASWGQHWLQFETPQWLARLNRQQEFNLHNMVRAYWSGRFLLLALLLYVGLLPILHHFFADVRFIAGRIRLPVPPLAFAPWGIVVAFVGDHPWLEALWGGPPSAWRYSEISETLFGVLMLGTAIDHWLRRRDCGEPFSQAGNANEGF